MKQIVNAEGLYRLGGYRNVTRPEENIELAERQRSVTFRSRPKEYEGLPQPSLRFSNIAPEFESKREETTEQTVYAPFSPPQAMAKREQSIELRNREYEENRKLSEEQRIEEYVRSEKGLRNLMGLVKSEYQVPVFVTRGDAVVSTKHPRCCDGYYEPNKQQIQQRVYYHI